ncbi:MAG: 16S rRNA (cytosine(1402)-N(4))-methyltransferase RsmH [Bdellovibrionales bacterium]
MLHQPVLLQEVMNLLEEMSRSPRRIMDGTFGRGGHTRAFLQKYPEAQVVACDRDAEAITYGEEELKESVKQNKLIFKHKNFAEIRSEEVGHFDGILVDLGVSSPQLDQGHRGFSFLHDGPLDMRMDVRETLTAAEIVNTWSSSELKRIFVELGEVSRPDRAIQNIVKERQLQAFETTAQLADTIAKADGWRRKGFHPATQYFMALRMQVNHELESIDSALETLIDCLEPQGRLMIITFHSIEDRLVKYKLKSLLHLGSLVNKKVIKPSWNEQKNNPRARSAKLRCFERGV